jgi:EpsI family protein
MRTNLLIGIVLLAAASLALALTPQAKQHVEQGPVLNLEEVFPEQIGEWKIDTSLPIVLPPQDVQESLQKIYSQTLSRTYINSSGERVMLSIAYGNGLDKQLDVHRPEYCYRAQGFDVEGYRDQVIKSAYGDIPVRRLVATQGSRIEPISYWITIGGKSVSSTFERKLLKLRRVLTDQVDSGLLIRVSTIEPDLNAAYATQEGFINALVGSIQPQYKQFILNYE